MRLCNFAAKQKWITRSVPWKLATPKRPKVVISDSATLNPDDLRKVLMEATPAELPSLVLLAFVPLRTAEVARLDWADIRIAERVVIVGAQAPKLSVRRNAPIPEAALEWLRGVAKESGPIWHQQHDPDGNKLANTIPGITRAAGAKYAKNCLRRSRISALMAIHEDAAKVSLWAGNSPRQIAVTFSARWTKAQGEAWLSERPE